MVGWFQIVSGRYQLEVEVSRLRQEDGAAQVSDCLRKESDVVRKMSDGTREE